MGRGGEGPSPFGSSIMKNMVPSEFYLSQNYPNPFSAKTTIKLCVAYKTRVTLDILNLENKIIKRLLDEEREAGTFEASFDASDLPEGSYVCVFQAGDCMSTKRMLLKR